MTRLAVAAFAAALTALGGIALAQPPPLEVDPGTVAIAPVSDPDPGGGPPWGLRTFRTTRGADCHQVGRIQDGKLGRVDDSGNFVEVPLQPNGCGGAARPGAPTGGSHGLVRQVTPAGIRTVFYGRFGPLLKRVIFADSDGANRRDLQVSPSGEYVGVVRGGVNAATQPRQRLFFDGACGPDRERILGLHTEAEVVGCQVIVPLDEPRPARESAASKRARKHPSRRSPVRATPTVAGPGRRITARFKVPITVQPGDGYGFQLGGRGAKKCRKSLVNGSSEIVQSFGAQVRGHWADLLLPLGGRSGRWCRGTYTVAVFFHSRGKRYAPFGSDTFRIR